MTTKKNPWFRMYSDFMFDDKIEFLSFEDQRHYVVLLCMKNAGLLDKDYNQPGMMDRVISRRLGLYGEAFESAKKRLIESGLIDSRFQPVAWDKRQYVSDSSTDRVHAYRERMKQARNVSVTTQEADTDTDTDTDKEEEKKGEKSADAPSLFVLPDWINKKHWDAWHSCAKRKKATDAQKQMAVEKLDAWRQAGIDFAGALENAAIGGWQGLFKPDDKKPAISQPTESFAERDARTKREAWEAMTNRKWPEQDLPGATRSQVIEAEPNTLRRIA